MTGWQEKKSFIKGYAQQKIPIYGILEADLTPNTLLTVDANSQYKSNHGHMSGGLTNYKHFTSIAPSWATSKTNTPSLLKRETP